MNNVISLQQAIEMTTRFREQNSTGGKMTLFNCETFDRAAFDAVLSQTGCVKLRIYSGLDANMGYRAIVVGVNEKDEDMLPSSTSSLTTGDQDPLIIEDGLTCPPYCPPPSHLNP